MNIFLIGATGNLGIHLIERFTRFRKYKLHTPIHKTDLLKKYRNNKSIIKCKINFFHKTEFKDYLIDKNINMIIHCAAMTNLDKCEIDKENSKKVNFLLTKKIVDAISNLSVKLVFISSDHIFGNNLNKLNHENSKTFAINFYAKCKILSENYIKNKLKNFLIIRTNFFGKSFSKNKMFHEKILKENQFKKIYLFRDIYFNPIEVTTLTKLIYLLIMKGRRGIYHCSSDQKISKLEFGLILLEIFKLNNSKIVPINLKDNKDLYAKRAKNMFIANHKIKKLFPKLDLTIRSQIKKYKTNLNVLQQKNV